MNWDNNDAPYQEWAGYVESHYFSNCSHLLPLPMIPKNYILDKFQQIE